MRRFLGLLATIGLLAAIFPATVAAAAPARLEESETRLGCDVSTDAGFVSLFALVSSTEALVSVLVWEPGADPESDMPTIMTGPNSVSFDGSSMYGNADLVLFENPEKAAGMARLNAQLTPIGDQMVIDSREVRDGTRLYKIELLMQQLVASGSLIVHLFDGTVEEIALTDEACDAGTLSSSYFNTDPDAYLTNTEQVFVSCEWASELGIVNVLAIADDFTHFSAITIIGSDRVLIGPAVPELTASVFQATYELSDVADSSAVGSATISAALSPTGERITDHDWMDAYRFNVVGEALNASGTLSITVDGATVELPLDEASCDAGDVRVQVMERIGRG